MAPEPTAPVPGNLTVPLMFGWQGVGAVLFVLLVLAAIWVVSGALRPDSSSRDEWEAWLHGRSRAGIDRGPGRSEADAVPGDPTG